MTSEPVTEVKIEDILRQMVERGHRGGRTRCPADGVDLMATSLTLIAYTFEVCDCGSPEYSHLVEQLWHRGCLAAGARS